MSSPKHLWTGDWEHDSQIAQSSLPAPPPPQQEEPPPPEPPASSSTYLRRRIIALTAISVLLIVGVVYAITSGGSNRKSPTTTGAARATLPGVGTATVPGTPPGRQPPPATTSTTPANPSQADALGLQLSLVPVNRVIVQAVVPGSPAEQVGIGAGDLLLTINGQRVTSPGQANDLLAKLPKGSQVTLNLVQGSEQIQATIQESNGP